MSNQENLNKVVGKVVSSVKGLEKESDEVVFEFSDGCKLKFHHIQDCCECVLLSDFEGDPEDLRGALITSAKEVAGGYNEGEKPDEYSESWTWTFYKIETNKGGLWMRWLGESNGYYSEEVNVEFRSAKQ